MESLVKVEDGRKNIFYILSFVIGWYDDYFLHDTIIMKANNEFTIISYEDLLKLFTGKKIAGRSYFFQHSTGINFSQFLLGMLREVSLHHPVIVLRFSL
jgi:hypothetical protein